MSTISASLSTSEPPRFIHRPEGSNWGDFGPDDRLGRLNLLTSEKVLQGMAEVREGLVFCLSLPLDYPGGHALAPARHPPVIRPSLRASGDSNWSFRYGRGDTGVTDVSNDDLAVLHLQYSTHWDSFAHNGQLFDADGDGISELVFYNGYRGGREVSGSSDPADAGVGSETTTSVTALGIEAMAEKGFQGRAVMVDLHRHLGSERTAIGYDQLMRVLETDGVTVEVGDIVCLHTGFAQAVLDAGKKPDPTVFAETCATLDGRDRRLLRWIADSGLAAIAADNFAVEQIPAADRNPGETTNVPIHELCLFRLGIPLGELFYLTELAAWLHQHKRTRFLLTAPPLRLPGAVGCPLTPLGTV